MCIACERVSVITFLILPMKITCVLVRAVLYCLLKMHYLSCCFYINSCLLK